MSDEITWVALADIVKVDKNPDGSRTVTGALSNPKKDLDRQIMDPDFFKRAAAEWFTQRANIREMHQPSAVGKGKELTTDARGLLQLTSKIVDPLAVKKVDEGVYTAYSAGIKNPRVVFDAEAPGGRIVDGVMVECSLVDYPASDVGKLVIAKAATPDEDTGAVALTDDELAALDKAAEPEATKEADSPATGANLTPDELRSAALRANPGATQADLDALVAAYQAICTPNQEAGGIKPEAAQPHNSDTDPDAGVSPTAADRQQARAGDEDDPSGPRKVTAEELLGSGALKAALADPDIVNHIRTLIAPPDTAKAATPDQVKAAVEEATKGLEGRLVKLEKSPAPSGPFVGPAHAVEKVLRINDSIEGAGASGTGAPSDPIRVRLERLATSDDPTTRMAAREALDKMATPTETVRT